MYHILKLSSCRAPFCPPCEPNVKRAKIEILCKYRIVVQMQPTKLENHWLNFNLSNTKIYREFITFFGNLPAHVRAMASKRSLQPLRGLPREFELNWKCVWNSKWDFSTLGWFFSSPKVSFCCRHSTSKTLIHIQRKSTFHALKSLSSESKGLAWFWDVCSLVSTTDSCTWQEALALFFSGDHSEVCSPFST